MHNTRHTPLGPSCPPSEAPLEGHSPLGATTAIARAGAIALLLVLVTGCKVNADDIEYWQRTVKGPQRITRVLLSERYSMELRTRAATALVEMERNDVEGLTLLEEGLEQLKHRDPDLPAQIVGGMVPRLNELMTEVPAGHSGEQGPPPMQIRAKDAAYVLLPYAQGEARDALTQAIVDWYAQDFVGRSLAGSYSVEQVVRSIGAPAAPRLVTALNARMPQQAIVKIAELIAALGDDQAKARGADRLVELEAEINEESFLEWLKTTARSQLGDDAPDARVLATAHLNREKWITEGILPAMKHLASQEAVRNRLIEIARTKPAEDTATAFAEAIQERRRKALQALDGHVGEAQLSAMLDLALDESNPVGVRDDAFDRVGDIGSAEAIPRLWPLMATEDNAEASKRLRWRAGELILKLGGSEVVEEFLQRLPSTPEDIQYEPSELESYAQQMSEMDDPPTLLLRRYVTGPQWWVQIIAMAYLQRRGTAPDATRIESRLRDPTLTAGEQWDDRDPPQTTVGAFATAALAALRERLASQAEAAE